MFVLFFDYIREKASKKPVALSYGRRLLKKSVFSKKCLFSIPIRTLCGLCVLQSLWAFYLGILAETPNPFPVVKGCVCLVGFASLQSPWAYTHGIRAVAECGAAALTPLGAMPQTPFSKIYRFFDRL